MGDVPLMVTGEFDESDLGVACYHSKLGGVELYLNHLVDGPGEYVVVDMTAGSDSLSSSPSASPCYRSPPRHRR